MVRIPPASGWGWGPPWNSGKAGGMGGNAGKKGKGERAPYIDMTMLCSGSMPVWTESDFCPGTGWGDR